MLDPDYYSDSAEADYRDALEDMRRDALYDEQQDREDDFYAEHGYQRGQFDHDTYPTEGYFGRSYDI